MSYDRWKTYERCYTLAADFLSDTPHLDTTDNCKKLAQWIEKAAKAWITAENYEPPESLPADFDGFAEKQQP